MKIHTYSMGPLETNTYILIKGNEALIIDPSWDSQAEYETIKSLLEGNQLVGIVCTHGHIDHISGIPFLLNDYDAPLYINPKERSFLTTPSLNLSSMMGKELIIDHPTSDLTAGSMTIGGFELTIFDNPGHTSGGQSFLFDNDLMCGDFIFKGGIGRMDFPTGSQTVMFESLKDFVLKHQDENFNIHPGHGPQTSLDYEIATNPYINHVLNQ